MANLRFQNCCGPVLVHSCLLDLSQKQKKKKKPRTGPKSGPQFITILMGWIWSRLGSVLLYWDHTWLDLLFKKGNQKTEDIHLFHAILANTAILKSRIWEKSSMLPMGSTAKTTAADANGGPRTWLWRPKTKLSPVSVVFTGKDSTVQRKQDVSKMFCDALESFQSTLAGQRSQYLYIT